MFKKQISLFVTTFLIIGFFFVALPEKGYSGLDMAITGCCQSSGSCFNVPSQDQLCTVEAFREGQICNKASGQCIQQVSPIPTLSEWGLVAMAGILGIVGFMVIRKRKVTA